MERHTADNQAKAQEVNKKVDDLIQLLNTEWGKVQAGGRLTALETRVKEITSEISNNSAAGVTQGGPAGSTGSGGMHSRGAMESKAIMNLKVQGSDRMGYRMWHEKLINAFAQVNHQYRGVLERIVRGIDHSDDIGYPTSEQWEMWLLGVVDHEDQPPRWDNMKVAKLNEDMYSVLMDKTEGDAWLRVKSVISGRGLEAFVRIYKWFAGTSGMGLSERARVIMAPTAPKSEGDIAEALDKWLEGLRLLQSHKGYRMSIQLKVTALEMLMTGRARDQFEIWEQDIPKVMEGDEAELQAWNELLGKVQDYATRRRLEANMQKGKSAMDVDGVDQGDWDGGWGYDQGNWDWTWEMGGDIDALGKGKSMGKGGKKGKGKGKGMFFGGCYNCHQPGHSAKFCPHPPKGGGKGKGKQDN